MRTALLAGLLAASSAIAQEEGPKPGRTDAHIRWVASWEDAIREAQIRNVPIFLYLSVG